jgi:hypothetical protein
MISQEEARAALYKVYLYLEQEDGEDEQLLLDLFEIWKQYS